MGSAAALFALFSAGCQPGDVVETEAGAGAVTSLAAFQTGQFEKLELSMDEMRLPTATILDAEGEETSLAQYAGKVVVLNIWGEWCPPCVEEMPTLANLQDAFDPADVVVIPVAFGAEEDRESAIVALDRLTEGRLPFFYDAEFAVTEQIQSGAFPSTLIYDRDGVEVARLIWPAEWDAPDAQALVQAVLDGVS